MCGEFSRNSACLNEYYPTIFSSRRYVGNLDVDFFDVGRMNLKTDRSMSSRAFCRCNSIAKACIYYTVYMVLKQNFLPWRTLRRQSGFFLYPSVDNFIYFLLENFSYLQFCKYFYLFLINQLK